MRTVVCTAAVLVGVLALGSVRGYGGEATAVAKKVLPSVCMISTMNGQGAPVCQGSGFVVRTGLVATNLHVLEDATSAIIKLPDASKAMTVQGVIAKDERHDLVLLRVDGASAPPLDLGDSSKLEIGDEVYAVGNPKGLGGTFSDGIVSAVRWVKAEYLIQTTAPISPGSSGGPLLNSTGDVVGVSVASVSGGQNLNFAVPACYLRSLIQTLPRKIEEWPPAVALGESSPRAAKSYLSNVGEKTSPILTIFGITGAGSHYVHFSIRNDSEQSVQNIRYIVYWYKDGELMDYNMFTARQTIAPGMAKRYMYSTPVGDWGFEARMKILEFEFAE